MVDKNQNKKVITVFEVLGGKIIETEKERKYRLAHLWIGRPKTISSQEKDMDIKIPEAPAALYIIGSSAIIVAGVWNNTISVVSGLIYFIISFIVLIAIFVITTKLGMS